MKVISTSGSVVSYMKDGRFHRADGPARVWKDGEWSWWLDGDWHRYYGPTRSNMTKLGSWFIHDEKIK